MADARLGGASFIASVNADRLVSGLNKAEGRIKRFGSETKSVWDKIGERFGGGGGGFVAKALGAGFFGGLAGAFAIRAFDFIREGISDVVTGKAKWTQELGRLNLQYQILEKNIARALKTADEFRDAGTPDERRRGLVNDILGTEGELATAQFRVNAIRDQLELLNSFGATNTFATLFGTREKEKAFLEADLGRAEATVLRLADRFGDLAEAKKRLDPEFDPAVKTSINAYVGDLDKKMRTLGMSAEEAALKLLELRGGPKGMLGDAGDKLAAFKAATEEFKFKELGKDADEFTRALERQFDALQEGAKSAERMKIDEFWEKGIGADKIDAMTLWVERLEKAQANAPAREFLKTLQSQRVALGMSADEARLLELRLGGAAQQLVRAAAVEASILAAVEEKKDAKSFEPKFAAAIEAGSQEAFGLDLKHKFGTQGGDPNKGVTLWDLNVALLKAAVTLQKIEAKVGKAGAF